MEIIKRRSGLKRLLQGIKKGSVTLGFIGGSITDQRTGKMWPEYVIGWFADNYPNLRVNVENAAIGATGSELAVFRAERDLINRHCDIVFIEFAVNDNDSLMEKRLKTREGLIRKLLKEDRDIVIVYTFSQPMYKDMINDKVPDSIKEFEELACHYKIGSVWMGLYALEEIKKGQMKWEEWLPDGLHPGYRGSFSYASSVISFLEKELISSPNDIGIPCATYIPNALSSNNYEKTSILPFEEVKLEGPWVIRRWSKMSWVDQVLDTDAVGAGLSFKFKGRGLSLGFDFGRYSSEFKYRLNKGEWTDFTRNRPGWCPDYGWFRMDTIIDNLPYGKHEFELIVTHGDNDECKGTNFTLALIGIIE